MRREPLALKQGASLPPTRFCTRIRADYGTPIIVTCCTLRAVKNGSAWKLIPVRDLFFFSISFAFFFSCPFLRAHVWPETRRWSRKISSMTDFYANARAPNYVCNIDTVTCAVATREL